MVMMLMLVVAGGLGLVRLLVRMPRRVGQICTAAIAIGIAADGWMRGMPQAEAPMPWSAPAALDLRQVSAVIELPLGDLGRDAAAFYRSIHHGRPVLNGISGHVPPHYLVLQRALETKDPDALNAFIEHGPLLVAIDRKLDSYAAWAGYVSHLPGAVGLRSSGTHAFFLLPRSAPPSTPGDGPALEIERIVARAQAVNLRDLVDDDRTTRWTSGAPQQGQEEVTIEFTSNQCVGSIKMSMGGYVLDFPRELVVETSPDGQIWSPVWHGHTAGRTIRAALRDPREVSIIIPAGAPQARAIRLRQVAQDETSPWSIAGIGVAGCSR